MALTLGFIVEQLGGELFGDAQQCIERIAPLETAQASDIGFVHNPRYRAQLAATRAACVIVAPVLRDLALSRGACIVAEDPYRYYARLSQLWRRTHPLPAGPAIHPSAVVDASAYVADSARIGPLCVVEAGAHIGANTVLHGRATVGHGCQVGARCIIHPGVVIGADGFGFAPHAQGWEKIEQLGAVRIGDEVEIGANTCIDRGALDDTVIEDGVKLDNLIQIGHNVRVGRETAMAACVGVAGSTTIGARCTVGGAAVILGHLTLGDGVHIDAASVVTRSLSRPGHYTGVFPIAENATWEKNAATLKQLHQLRDRLRRLEQLPKR